MYDMIQDRFTQLCDENIINETEANSIVEELSDILNEDKDMYQSDNKEEFIDKMLVPLFENVVSKREKLIPPTEEELRNALIEQYEDVLFIH